MSLQFLKAGTADALVLNAISKLAFDSDVEAGAPSAGAGGLPGHMSLKYHMKMAKSGYLFKLTENDLIVGGAILFRNEDTLNIGRIFIDPQHFRKGYGIFMMREIEALFPDTKVFTLDTPVWNTRTNAFYTRLGYSEVKRAADLVYYSKNADGDAEKVTPSTPRDIVNQCSRGFAFPADFPLFSGLQPSGLQRSGKAPCRRLENAFSANFRK